MNKSIIAEGKTSTEAINKGLKELGVKKDDVNIKILEEEDKKIFFNILEPRKVKVELTLKNINEEVKIKKEKVISPEIIAKCKENIVKFLDDLTNNMEDLKYTIKEDKELFIELEGESSKDLIGYRGNAINSLQSLLFSIGNKNNENTVQVYLDINNYREKRKNTLISLAHNLEKKVIRNNRKEVLEPMPAYERKIIHTALQDSTKVITYSIGEDLRRKVIIDLKK